MQLIGNLCQRNLQFNVIYTLINNKISIVELALLPILVQIIFTFNIIHIIMYKLCLSIMSIIIVTVYICENTYFVTADSTEASQMMQSTKRSLRCFNFGGGGGGGGGGGSSVSPAVRRRIRQILAQRRRRRNRIQGKIKQKLFEDNDFNEPFRFLND